jgi:hypothetical protein
MDGEATEIGDGGDGRIYVYNDQRDCSDSSKGCCW